ncbi:MAG: carboxypeptidase M32 [Candidatus Scalindua sp. AMX11]|nr:MAG: carboxypeptidase M32 [Candidatus Scalindua sp.]NOG84754.1 carboxypeptidase M32 [Planctomycetota bacterium]RZV98358.1 MAG: carboxypeptidase M32 [Candidatus Scalindua sp. SCAELEC01]TDE66549.1 MAG: carboxypeptidase M32 [Candidatus Scalindua sp. AMX11]GJQ58915.1 MAG: carboxypeptidase M32 [Candidatus Scalindua sp.]
MDNYENLLNTYKKSTILESIGEALQWDQEVMMPEGALPIRSQQSSTLAALKHDILTSDEMSVLLVSLEDEDLNSDQSANVREIKRNFTRAKKIPNELVRELSETTIQGVESWKIARQSNDFKIFLPSLRNVFALSTKVAECIDPNTHPYEVLLESYEQDMSVEEIQRHLNTIKEHFVPLIARIKDQEIDNSLLTNDIDVKKQIDFNRFIAKAIGYDFSKGRLDVSEHPFTACYGRITTRYNTGWWSAISGTIHEAGHGMYEHHLPLKSFGLPLGQYCSMSIHESQSRFWENNIGKSKPFWRKFFPNLSNSYGLDVDLEKFYKIINKVEPNLIRIEADELTYSLHIILRFEIELGLIEGTIKFEELPEVWNQKFKEYLGIVPPTDSLGVLQDIHWSWGNIGYFPTYTLGSMIAAQLFAAAEDAIPHLANNIEQGNFENLRSWLNDNIWCHGKRYLTKELIRKATGKDPAPDDYVDYLKTKYSEIYAL